LSRLVSAGPPGLPELIQLNHPLVAYDIWALWVATDRKFLPSQLLQEPVGLLDDMLLLDSVYATIQEQYKGTNP
jgi:hypothetical protein